MFINKLDSFSIFNEHRNKFCFQHFDERACNWIYDRDFCKKKKCPAINYIIIGIIPLVPGLKVYQGMLKLIEGDIFPGISLLLEAAFIAIAIGVSILVSTSVARVIRLRKQKKLIRYQHPNAPN